MAVLAAAEHRDIVHRPRPIERVERDDVLEHGRLHRRQRAAHPFRSEEHTSGLQSLMRISYAVFCLKNKNRHTIHYINASHTDLSRTQYSSTRHTIHNLKLS